MGFGAAFSTEMLSLSRWLIVLALIALLLYRSRRFTSIHGLARELSLLVGAFFLYFFVRGITESSESKALANADYIIRLEDWLGILWEPAMQSVIVNSNTLITLANWVYIWGHWPLIALVALWLYVWRPPTYRLYRNAFIISGAIGLVIFAAFPVAPPRLTEMDLIDTVTSYSNAYRVLQPPALVNQYAAVPSLHFGWNMLIGIALVQEARSWLVKACGVLMPVLMFFAIVLTANHFILDAVAGAAVALAGLLIAKNYALPIEVARRNHREQGEHGERARRTS